MALRSRAKGSFFQSIAPESPGTRRDDQAGSRRPETRAFENASPRRRRALVSPRIEAACWVTAAVLLAVVLAILGA